MIYKVWLIFVNGKLFKQALKKFNASELLYDMNRVSMVLKKLEPHSH